jgi:hypothetical protein
MTYKEPEWHKKWRRHLSIKLKAYWTKRKNPDRKLYK